MLAPLLVFGPGLVAGKVFYGKDTLQFYFPLTEWFVGQLKTGSVPLWLPDIFGGYPLFADGEIGMAHPLVLIAGALFSAETAFTLVRYAQYALAAVLAYCLATVLGLRSIGASVAGLVFALSSFLVGHMQHDNIVRSSVWLPALLACTELALRSTGWMRVRNMLLGGLVLGVQLLGVHVQPVLISLLAVGGWLLVGPLGPDTRVFSAQERHTALTLSNTLRVARERFARVWLWGLMVVVGLLVSAVQLLPLGILSGGTMRGAGVNYFVSTSYAISPPELLTLIFPYFFRSGPEQHWSLWPPQETTLYFGILPLALAMIAIVFVRGRLVFWLAIGALFHFWLALGDYASPNPYYLLWNLPGFSVLRAPARFSLVIVLAMGCLAGLGADWLQRRTTAGLTTRQVAVLRVMAVSWAAALIVFISLGVVIRRALEAAPSEMLESIDVWYLALRRELQQLGAPNVAAGLTASADLGNPSTRLSLVWMVCTILVLLLWTFGARWRRLGRVLIVPLVAADLLTFAGAFYPQASSRDLRIGSPVVQQLVARKDAHHVLIDPALYQLVGANQLIHYGVSVAGGYSSLEPTRFLDYWWAMVRDENTLMDLFNVRYMVVPRQQSGNLMFNDTRFHPAERLVNGGASNPAGFETLRGSGIRADSLTVVSAVDGIDESDTGGTVAQLTLISPDGEERTYDLRYGEQVTGYRRGAPNPSHALWAYYGPAFVPIGRSFPVQLSGAVLPIDPPLVIDRIEVRYTAPSGVLLLHGLGLRDADTFTTRSLTSADRLKYEPIYRDEDVVVLENHDALPKVYFRVGAETTRIDSPVAQDLESRPTNPSRDIVLDSEDGWAAREPAADAQGEAQLLQYGTSSLSASVHSNAGGFLVVGDRFDAGWRAWVDGHETPVVRANAVMRAVPVDAGDHVVEMYYDPWWIRVGVLVSLLSVLGVMTTVVAITRRHPRQ
ncbi:MAG TPA: YfhO family protein [Chloroflexota bacterium]|nr:YfhO family protein [Chloroflexota bacterium]